ncbi:MAG: substrate-binding domain-containing protein, partial [Nodosilinea sp.]
MLIRHGANASSATTSSVTWRRPLLWFAAAPLLAAIAMSEGGVSLWAQTAGPLDGVEIPASLEPGSQLSIASSEAMRTVNEALRSRFSNLYDASVEVTYQSADEAMQSLVDRSTDLAAIGRSLSDAETTVGLREVPVARQKIAVVVSPSNPFAGGLTDEQFAQIFRGEIANWSEVGGQDAAIELVDHPASSDTRQALRSYPVFEVAPFEAAPGAVTLQAPSAEEIAATLSENGISYVVAEQALNNPAVKVVPLHDTLPDDPRYPFSQPLTYVYNAAIATPATLAFLEFALSPDSTELISSAQSVPAADLAELAPEEESISEPTSEVAPAPDPAPEPANAIVAPELEKRVPWWPWLLTLPLLGGLLWWLLKGRDPAATVPAPAAAPLATTRRIILTPRTCRDAYVYWELPEAEAEALRQQSCVLALKLHDVTDIADVDRQAPHSMLSFDCDTVAVGDRHLPLDVDNRDYLAELGYLDPDSTWHALARSASVRVPACLSPVAPV